VILSFKEKRVSTINEEKKKIEENEISERKRK